MGLNLGGLIIGRAFFLGGGDYHRHFTVLAWPNILVRRILRVE